jgi:valyl-tRNA synthetase
VLAEELYELYLKKIDEVSKVISANRELTEPMNMDRVIDQLLRLARNAGWIKTVVEEPEKCDCNTCNKCVVTHCSNRTCDNYVEKKKVKVKGKLPLRLPKKAKKGGK